MPNEVTIVRASKKIQADPKEKQKYFERVCRLDEVSDGGLKQFAIDCTGRKAIENAHALAPIYRQALDLYARVKESDLSAEAKAGLKLELGAKIAEFQDALKELLGLDMAAFRTNETTIQGAGSAATRPTRLRAASLPANRSTSAFTPPRPSRKPV